jgi:methionyl-tRNA formyltransferase
MRIIFMGTPEFAVPTLKILIESGYNVVAVVTAEDKPKGRGQILSQNPVKTIAMDYKIPVLQPLDLKDPDFIETLKSYKADLQIVVAFRMLPTVVWSMPPLGTVNLHASLLPNYRGAAPINWAVINGEKETGISTFFIEEKMDTGYVIFQEKEPIYEKDTAGDLHDRLMQKGGQLVLKTLKAIESGVYPKTPQCITSTLKLAPKIHKEDCEINWDRPAADIVNFVRGMAPRPGAYTIINDISYKILEVEIFERADFHLAPGKIETNNKNYLAIGTETRPLHIKILQQPGKKAMQVESFLRGNKIITL